MASLTYRNPIWRDYIKDFPYGESELTVFSTAWEVRVLAEPDFPRTILKEFQINEMSADWDIQNGYAQTQENPPQKTKNLHSQNHCSRPKRFWKGFGGTFSSKRFPQRIPERKINVTLQHQRIRADAFRLRRTRGCLLPCRGSRDRRREYPERCLRFLPLPCRSLRRR